MKKRGIFSLVLLVACIHVLAAEDYTDIGTAGELIVFGQALYKSQQDTASYVSVISAQDIQRIKPATTAELLQSSLGMGFRSYGALGAVQNVQIRGARSSQVEVYLDGVLMTSAHDRTFDVNSIPVSSIDHVEIIRSGSGSLGKANSLGGMVNIVTKKGKQTETPFRISVETGSYLPEQYQSDGDTKRNIIGLADSLKLDLSYGDSFGNLSVAAGLGAVGAQNNYTYESGDELLLRENAGMWAVHGNASLIYDIQEAGVFSLQNITRYQHAGVPGSLSWPSDDHYQNDMLSTTSAGYTRERLFDGLMDLQAAGSYTYEQRFYHGFSDSTHHKHKAGAETDQKWRISDALSLSSGISVSWDGIRSTDAGDHDRYSVGTFGAGSIYLAGGDLALHPVIRADYASDFGIGPNGSLGVIYSLNNETTFQLNAGYARQLPSFSDLYWPSGNPDLNPEKGWTADAGVSYSRGSASYEGTIYVRSTRDLIDWSTDDFITWTPENISHAFFLGTEQEFEFSFTDSLAMHAGYLLNYSWDLSNDNTFSTDQRVAHTRMHTVHVKAHVAFEAVNASLSGRYLGKSDQLDSALVIDAVVNWQAGDQYAFYAAVDNLLNTRYELNDDYPMPGMKVRLGSYLSF